MTLLPLYNLFYVATIHWHRRSNRFIITVCSQFSGTAKGIITTQPWRSCPLSVYTSSIHPPSSIHLPSVLFFLSNKMLFFLPINVTQMQIQLCCFLCDTRKRRDEQGRTNRRISERLWMDGAQSCWRARQSSCVLRDTLIHLMNFPSFPCACATVKDDFV